MTLLFDLKARDKTPARKAPLLVPGSTHTCAVRSDSLRPRGLKPPRFSFVREVFLAKLLESVATSSSRGSSRPRDQTHISYPALQADSLSLYHLASYTERKTCSSPDMWNWCSESVQTCLPELRLVFPVWFHKSLPQPKTLSCH